jgi:hypothetical protein
MEVPADKTHTSCPEKTRQKTVQDMRLKVKNGANGKDRNLFSRTEQKTVSVKAGFLIPGTFRRINFHGQLKPASRTGRPYDSFPR